MLVEIVLKSAERRLLNISKFQCGGRKKEDVYKKFVNKKAKYHKKCSENAKNTQFDQNHFHESNETEEFGPTVQVCFFSPW